MMSILGRKKHVRNEETWQTDVLRAQGPSRPSQILQKESLNLYSVQQSKHIVQDHSKGIGQRQSLEYPSISFLCSALRGPLRKPYLQEWKHLSFYWAMCLCWKTCLGFRVQGFYWTMVTKAPMRSHNKWNFRLSEGKQVFSAPGRQNNLISVSTFQRQIFQTPAQGQSYK